MNCYCEERKINPKLAEKMKNIPKGYCGLCEVCEKPGHLRAHPRLPTTGEWCDKHWNELLNYRIITLGDITQYLFYLFTAGMLIYTIMSAWKTFS